MPVHCTRIRPLEHEFYLFAVFIAFIYLKVLLDVLKVFKGDIKRVTREVVIKKPADQP